jgi:hypothetical protein
MVLNLNDKFANIDEFPLANKASLQFYEIEIFSGCTRCGYRMIIFNSHPSKTDSDAGSSTGVMYW